jgi:hypothetical protein
LENFEAGFGQDFVAELDLGAGKRKRE